MSKKLRIVLAQLNFCVGDLTGNIAKLMEAASTARDTLKADVIIFPELCVTGYPPEDLLLRKSFLESTTKALEKFTRNVYGIHSVVGHPQMVNGKLYNSCSLLYNGKCLGQYHKQFLPNYGVFDECRYFNSGDQPLVISINNVSIGILICEDLWKNTPIKECVTLGAQIIVSLNASPFEVEKHEKRQLLLAKHSKNLHIPILYVNNVGKQDEIVFDGGSMATNSEGELCEFAGFFQEKLLPIDINISPQQMNISSTPYFIPQEDQRIYDCLVLGVQDYLRKNNFSGALIGVSGGIDSALTLAIAVDALGPDRVEAVLMPSRYTSQMSMDDGLELVHNFKVKHHVISIETMFQSFLNALNPSFECKSLDSTEENIQARCRGVILMALSNKSGKIVLTTGNRSELAVGYATLYGDMCGGLAVLKDIPKTMVYQLTHYRNQIKSVIPERIINRPPTAELAPDQKDEDSLPPYPILDEILELYLNQEMSIKEIAAMGFDEQIIIDISKMIKKNEYKRRQGAIGIRINHNSFIRDRRYPITSNFIESDIY